MALDITVVDNHDQPIKSYPFYLDVYESINYEIKDLKGFELTKNLFSDYFKDYVFYLNDLPILKTELLQIKELFESKKDVKAIISITEVLSLIDYAIQSRNMIKAIAD